jgi:hypothetical protein
MAESGSKRPDVAQMEASGLVFEKARNADDREQLPPIDFPTFVLSLSHSAFVHLGDAKNPVDSSQQVNLPLARQTIDLLALLQEKTKGNLSGEEERIIEQSIYDLRMRYAEVAKRR